MEFELEFVHQLEQFYHMNSSIVCNYNLLIEFKL